jgi:hypothetical protein
MALAVARVDSHGAGAAYVVRGLGDRRPGRIRLGDLVALLRTGDQVDSLAAPVVQVAFLVAAGGLALALVLRTSTLRIQGGEL